MKVIDIINEVYKLAIDGGDRNIDKAYKLIKSLKKHDLAKLSISQLAEFYFVSGKLACLKDYSDEAIRILTKALPVINQERKPEVLFYLIISCMDKNEYENAIDYARDALRCRNCDINLRIKILTQMCLSYENTNNYKHAASCARMILRVYKRDSQSDKYYYYNALLRLIVCYWKIGNDAKFDECVNLFFSLEKDLPKFILRSGLHVMGHISWNKKAYITAIDYYKKAKQFAEESKEIEYDNKLINNCKHEENSGENSGDTQLNY